MNVAKMLSEWNETIIQIKKEIDELSLLVHFCDYSSQPDVHLICEDDWTIPSWRVPPLVLPEYVYEADCRKLYTFEKELVNCNVCLKLSSVGKVE